MYKDYAYKPLKDFDDLKFGYDIGSDGYARMTFDNLTCIRVTLFHRAYYYNIEVGFADQPNGNIWLEKEIDVFMPGFSKLHSELHDRIESVPMPDYPELYEEMHRKVDEALISILMHKMQEIPRLTFKEREEYPNHLK